MENKLRINPEDEFNNIIDAIEFRAMASDGPVTPTLQAASEQELSRLWELVNEISPKRKALARKMLKVETASDEEVNEYLRNNGLDPEQIAREGSVFVKTLQEKLRLEKLVGKDKWHSPERFPDPSPDAPEISVTVLLYDQDFKMHGLGWYNFDKCTWNAFEEFYLENPFVWCYAPKP